MIRNPLLSWRVIGLISLVPSLLALVVGLVIFPSVSSGIVIAALLLAPVNLVAVALPAVAGRFPIHLALVGIIAALAVRIIGAILTTSAVLVLAPAPSALAPALITCCILLLITLGIESYLYASRLQPMPTTVPTESARV